MNFGDSTEHHYFIRDEGESLFGSNCKDYFLPFPSLAAAVNAVEAGSECLLSSQHLEYQYTMSPSWTHWKCDLPRLLDVLSIDVTCLGNYSKVAQYAFYTCANSSICTQQEFFLKEQFLKTVPDAIAPSALLHLRPCLGLQHTGRNNIWISQEQITGERGRKANVEGQQMGFSLSSKAVFTYLGTSVMCSSAGMKSKELKVLEEGLMKSVVVIQSESVRFSSGQSRPPFSTAVY